MKKLRVFVGLVFIIFTVNVVAQNNSAKSFSAEGPGFLHKLVAVLQQSYGLSHDPIQIQYKDSFFANTFLATIEEKIDFGFIAYSIAENDLQNKRIIQLPFVLYGLVPIVNIQQVNPGQMVLNKDILRNIYLGKIRYWDDSAITQLNPNLSLPHKDIILIKRPENSAFSLMLAQYTGLDKNQVASYEGLTSLSVIIKLLKKTDGSLTVLPYYVADDYHLSWTKLINQAGNAVSPTVESQQAAIHDFKPGISAKGVKAWPMTGYIYMIVHRNFLLQKSKIMYFSDFFNYIYRQRKLVSVFGYVPLPEFMTAKILSDFNRELQVSESDKYPLRVLFPTVKPITTQDLLKLYVAHKVHLIDVRSTAEYNIIHIKDSIHVELSSHDFIKQIKKIAAANPKIPIVMYCNGNTCAKSYRGVEMSQLAGIRNIFVYDAGVYAWTKSYPEYAVLLNKNPADIKNLIPQDDFQNKLLDYSQFKTKQLEMKGLIIDIREEIQRRFKLTDRAEVKHRLLKTEGVLWIPFNQFIQLLKQGKYRDRTLFIFDSVGKQIQWLQYYLREYGYQHYWFLKGGVRAVLGEEKHF